jgi:hypothetical protein
MPNAQDQTTANSSGNDRANTVMQQALAEHVAGAVESSRKVTTRQLIFACILMLVGAAVGVISVELKDTAVAAGFGTALIGAGATLLPAGASASANAQLHSALTQLAVLAAPPQAQLAPTQQFAQQPLAAAHTPPQQVVPAPAPRQVAAAPALVDSSASATPVAGQQVLARDIHPALPAAAPAHAADDEVATEAQVVNAADADAADAAALRAEQPG